MTGQPCLRSIARLGLAGLLAAILVGGLATSPDATASAASRWTGGVDLYRTGVFTTQQTWLWCTAADVQIIRNIVDHATDHTRTNQQRYFDYMRAHDRYRIPVSDGVDPGGWAAGLRHFVDGRYRLFANGSFDSALRSAVTNLRKTNLPVAITVEHGNHAWIVTGFTATADPATTTHFTVTSVSVVGPLWGLQSTSYGYDMRPDRKLTVSQLRGFFTPWHYAGVRMAWEGDWVSVQPVAAAQSAPKPTTGPVATTRPKATPRATPATTAAVTPAWTTSVAPDPSPTVAPTPPLAAVAEIAAPGPSAPPSTSIADSSVVPMMAGLIVLVAAAVVVLGGLAVRRRPRG
jgi:cell division septation protein DedD